ncbi:hypothetical protein [Burkholderia ambifaria]|uniref:hypothetical protein n=1 Tax=Burkholderia ambifaria TaxID=152480 RepID=UPI00158D2983|nr:hypothetical protein [Burkholderia ambifaria]
MPKIVPTAIIDDRMPKPARADRRDDEAGRAADPIIRAALIVRHAGTPRQPCAPIRLCDNAHFPFPLRLPP